MKHGGPRNPVRQYIPRREENRSARSALFLPAIFPHGKPPTNPEHPARPGKTSNRRTLTPAIDAMHL
ncbi:MAG: hypothetical protein C4531_03205 [Desulfurivibrio sp.]|nr:MAG: hypothetical protein C4531_03205 [Desulfurivibrio sp.]